MGIGFLALGVAPIIGMVGLILLTSWGWALTLASSAILAAFHVEGIIVQQNPGIALSVALAAILALYLIVARGHFGIGVTMTD